MMAEQTIASIWQETKELCEFFGQPLGQVNQIMIRIAKLDRPRPDWLQGKGRLEQLPRYIRCKDTPPPGFHNIKPIDLKIKTLAVAERVAWIVEELNYKWTLLPSGFWFESDKDALMFKLRWS